MTLFNDNSNAENIENPISDISEDSIRETMPEILDILLLDRTLSTEKKKHNIIWANDNYIAYGPSLYAPTNEIKPELVTGLMGDLIKPRALKSQEIQKERTKTKAEVFTPTWVVKKQNDEVDKSFTDDDLVTYTNRTWLEITCGEAPYMATRYDMETGELVTLADRVGFLDRKLQRINRDVDDIDTWNALVEQAYKASFGFEWSGDSLLLARENLLYTFRDYYIDKWDALPDYEMFEKIAMIISYNVFQMDGLKYEIPLSERREQQVEAEMDLFADFYEPEPVKWVVKPGKRVKVMNWDNGKMEYFDKNN